MSNEAAPAYTPRPNSAVARIIGHLATHGGNWVRARDVASALGMPSAYLGTSTIGAAVTHGLVRRRRTRDGVVELAIVLADSNAAPSSDDPFDGDEARGGKPLQRTVPAAAAPRAGKPGPASVFDLGGAAPPPSGFKGWLARKGQASAEASRAPAKRPARAPKLTPPVAVVTTPPPRPAAAAPSLSCAVFNTGELLLEVPGQAPLRLDGRQTADLLRWLQRVQPTIAQEPA